MSTRGVLFKVHWQHPKKKEIIVGCFENRHCQGMSQTLSVHNICIYILYAVTSTVHLFENLFQESKGDFRTLQADSW